MKPKAIFFIIVLLLFYLFVTVEYAFGSWDAPVSKVDALMRIFIHESGWNALADQHGIYGVLLKRSKRVVRIRDPFLWISKRYSTKTFRPIEVQSFEKDHKRSARQKWINNLSATCDQPKNWPTVTSRGNPHPPWKQYKDDCIRVRNRARQFLSGKLEPGCPEGEIDHWGGDMDTWRARKEGWVEVPCDRVVDGELYQAKNTFWCNDRISECTIID